MAPPPNLPDDDEIIAAIGRFCDERETRPMNPAGLPEDGGTWHGFAYPSKDPIVWVKLAMSMGEARMQMFAYQKLNEMPPSTRRNVRIPEIYRLLEGQRGYEVYIVMEFVNGKPFGYELPGGGVDIALGNRLLEQVVYALQLLLSIEVPPNCPPGPLGGGRIHHIVFKDQEAPIEYASVSELQTHFNKVLEIKNRECRIDFSGEKMQFTYSDIHRYNVLFTNKDEGYIYIIDFGHASFLPSSFMSYALWDGRHSLARDVADCFYPGRTNELYSKNDNVKTLHALRTFWVIGHAYTGLPL